jgi:hypothetical protein
MFLLFKACFRYSGAVAADAGVSCAHHCRIQEIHMWRVSRSMMAVGGLVVAIAVGLAPTASAQTPFKNCTQAKASGYCDIPSSSPYYGPWLDRDQDGLACEC